MTLLVLLQTVSTLLGSQASQQATCLPPDYFGSIGSPYKNFFSPVYQNTKYSTVVTVAQNPSTQAGTAAVAYTG
jgi:hypothetical protein